MIDADRQWLSGEGTTLTAPVRDEVAQSWRRSQISGVDPGQVGPVVGREDVEWRISRVGVPVLASKAELLVGANTSLLMSAVDGTLLWRWAENSTLRKRLDKSSVVLGTRWSEDAVGTNGLGTALETSHPVTIVGNEHYCEALHGFTCAGAPIRHPVTGRVMGVLSLASLVKDSSPLMAPTLLRLAKDVEQELYSDASQHERERLQHYLAERRRSRHAVIALSADVFIANAAATRLDLDRGDLWGRIEDAPQEVVGWELPNRMRISAMQSVMRGGVLVGAVVVAEEDPAALPPRFHPLGAVAAPAQPTRVNVAADVRRALADRDQVLVVGESGVGKRTLITAVAAEDRGAVVVDCALLAGQSSREWLAAARHRIAGRAQSTVVLAHLASLDERTAGSLAAILDDAAGEDLHVVGTSAASATIPQAIRDRFMLECIEFPPLRRRPHDVRSRIDEQPFGAPRLSQRALNLALRHPWPGNDRQLESFVAWLRTQQRAFVDVDELPAEWRASAHRHGATALQQAESETIAAALRENGGNKAVSAKALGISRSSLYRKMREYHLE